MAEVGDEQQGELIPALRQARKKTTEATATTRRSERRAAPIEEAEDLPVARVLVDLPLHHLDRPFDYRVPAGFAERAVPGARVKVRFAGQDVDGFVLERVATSDHPGQLAWLRRAVSAEPVLSPEIASLCDQVAARYAGTRSDVLRLAVPPRHATVEKETTPPAPPPAGDVPADTSLTHYPGGAELLEGLAHGARPRRVWTVAPGDDWAEGLARLASATLLSGRGSLLCVPDKRDLARLDRALHETLGAGQHVTLSADLGPAARYRAFLTVARGGVKVVAGTRAAAFAPVHDLGLVAIWDDGDDSYAEPRAPYPHTREVLLLRAHHTECAAVLAASARSVEAASLVTTGWAAELVADRAVLREVAPRVSITGATDTELERDPLARSSRLPRTAYEAIRTALTQGPVLVQTPRLGYAAMLACASCRAPARCTRCTGPLTIRGAGEHPACSWCGQEQHDLTCPECGSAQVRAPVVGDRRTAEELGRAFPKVTVRRSTGEHVLDTVPAAPSLVIATPGAEPAAEGGYACVVLMDTWLMLGRPDLRVREEAVRRWFRAASLARPGSAGGRVVAVGDPGEVALQALVRWDPAGFADREGEERASAHLPPTSRLAVLSAAEEPLLAFLGELTLPVGAEVLGPAPLPVARATTQSASAEQTEEQMRLLVRVPRRLGGDLSRALREVQGVRSARKLPAVRVRIDPWSLE